MKIQIGVAFTPGGEFGDGTIAFQLQFDIPQLIQQIKPLEEILEGEIIDNETNKEKPRGGTKAKRPRRVRTDRKRLT